MGEEHGDEGRDDRELVRSAAGGDGPAFETLVRRHTETVWRMARSLLHDDLGAEEVVQDTFLRAHGSLAAFPGEAKVTTWLLTICRRACSDRLRRTRAEGVPLDEARRLRHRDPRVDLELAIEAALNRLPGEEREAFVLVEVVGHSREDAARIVEVPASTMRSRVARARSKLARALDHARYEATGG